MKSCDQTNGRAQPQYGLLHADHIVVFKTPPSMKGQRMDAKYLGNDMIGLYVKQALEILY